MRFRVSVQEGWSVSSGLGCGGSTIRQSLSEEDEEVSILLALSRLWGALSESEDTSKYCLKNEFPSYKIKIGGQIRRVLLKRIIK